MKQFAIKKKAQLWAVVLLALAVGLPVPGINHAEESVSSIYLELVPSALKLYVDDETYALKVWANVTGGTASSKEVTGEATWTTSNSAVAKVDNGVVSGISSGARNPLS